jgi:FkbM family methyltransferase
VSDGASRVRAAAYVKEYPVERRDERLAAPAQRRRIEELARERGWDLVSVYEDAGRHVKPWDYDELERLLVELDGVDWVIVTRLDRFGQRSHRILQILEQIRAAGAELISLDEGADTGAGTGRAVQTVLAELCRWEPVFRHRPVKRWDVGRLAGWGFAPATVIDAGAAAGTPQLYEAFPDAYLVAVEPLAEFRPNLEQLVAGRPGEYVPVALGSRTGTIELEVGPDLLLSSSLPKVRPLEVDVEMRQVPITTLDLLAAEREWKAPFGLKIDTEGAERDIVQGGTETLSRCEFVISEMSVHERFEGAGTCAEFIALMRSRGFDFVDVLDVDVGQLGLHADGLFRRSA